MRSRVAGSHAAQPSPRSSTRSVRIPAAAASAAAARPATPPPTTSTSTCTVRTAFSAGAARSGSRPIPVARRITRSATAHANRGRMNVFE